MVKTRSEPSASADKERAPEPSAVKPDQHTKTDSKPAGAESLPHSTSSLNILSIIEQDIASLSNEGKTIVSVIIKAMQSLNDGKDQRIEQLETKVSVLEKKLAELENQADDTSQYERRDTLIISGPLLPPEVNNEKSSDVVVNAIKQNLHINFSPNDINIAHRIGRKSTQTKNRPIIVKLHSRQKKDDIMNACITVKPNLYINESLTPKRLSLLKLMRNIRKEKREFFQQLYTKDGTICVKLTCSNQKYFITNEETLNNFLDKFPVLKDINQQ